MKIILWILPLISLMGCVGPRANVQGVLDSWIGDSESHLIERWGIPDRQMESDGMKVYEYNRRGPGAIVPIGGMYVSRQFTDRWTFYIQDGKIVKDFYQRQ